MNRTRRCAYVVAIDAGATENEVTSLARYLSMISMADCEVVILDGAAGKQLESHRRVVRWVGAHIAIKAQHRLPGGDVDTMQAALDASVSEKIVIADPLTRYSAEQIEDVCDLLEYYDAVEPAEYIAPLPWWGGIDAGRLLLDRAIEQPRREHSTFAFRRDAFRPIRGVEVRAASGHLRRLALSGASVHEADDLFVRREPPRFGRWFASRAHEAAADLESPVRVALFLGIIPLLVLLAIIGGTQLAGGYAGVVAFASTLLAVRGRTGARRFFPLRSCLFAPLWLAERSVSVYCALFQRLRGSTAAPARASAGASRERVVGE